MKVFIAIIVSAILFGCVETFSLLHQMAGRSYVYKTEMTNPLHSEDLRFENDTFSIDFDLKPKGVQFLIYNKFSDGIRINWDETSLTLNGKTFRTLHKQTETGGAYVHEVQPSTTIFQNSNLEDYLFPSDRKMFIRSVWDVKPLPEVRGIFPNYDNASKKQKEYILKLKGARLTVFLPFYIGDTYVPNYFDIVIRDIILKK